MFRTFLLIGASAMALSATSAEALTFVYTGTIQHYTVATTGIYRVVAAGAHGAGQCGAPYGNGDGGQGIAIGAYVSLTAGTLLDIIVGAAAFLIPPLPLAATAVAAAAAAAITATVRRRRQARTEPTAARLQAAPAARVAQAG